MCVRQTYTETEAARNDSQAQTSASMTQVCDADRILIRSLSLSLMHNTPIHLSLKSYQLMKKLIHHAYARNPHKQRCKYDELKPTPHKHHRQLFSLFGTTLIWRQTDFINPPQPPSVFTETDPEKCFKCLVVESTKHCQ